MRGANGQVQPIGYINIGTNQVSVGASATQIIAARVDRNTVTIVNHGSVDVYLGIDNTVTTSTGVLLPGVKGASISLPVTTPVWGIVGAGSQTVSYLETW